MAVSGREQYDDRTVPYDVPFLRHLGAQVVGMGDGCAEITLTLRAEHMNSWDVAHGGVTMTLLDVVMALAGRSLEPEARAGVTVEMKTSFLQPGGKPGSILVAKGKAFHRSTTMCFCEGELWNADRLVAKSMGTFKYIKRARTPVVPTESPGSTLPAGGLG